MRKLLSKSGNRGRILAMAAGALGLFASANLVSAAGSLWTGAAADGGNWNNANNWSPLGVPNSPSAAVNFGSNGVGNVLILSSVQASALLFSNPTGNYNLSSFSGQTLGGLVVISVSPLATGTQTIDLANVATGSMLVTTSALIIHNDAAPTASPTLVIGSNTVIAHPGAGSAEFFIDGAGTTLLSGAIGSGMNGLSKSGPGTLTLSGNNASFAGATNFLGGGLVLDYATIATSKIPSSSLLLGGGDLLLRAHATTAFTQNVSSTEVSYGHTALRLSANGGTAGININLGAITHSSGSTLDVITDTNSNALTSSPTTSGILGGWATVNGGAGWAAKSGSNIVPLAVYGLSDFSPGTNTDIDDYESPAAGFTTNSIRFNPAEELDLQGSNTVQSGGILVTPGSSSYAYLTGGTLTTVNGSQPFYVHVYNNPSGSDGLGIDSHLVSSAGLVKTGPGRLGLWGLNPGLTGPININRGDVYAESGAISAASAINFNDNRTGATQTFFLEQIGSVTVNSPIRFSAAANASVAYPNIISSQYGVTLSGIISSAPGTVTPIRIEGGDGDGVNLTGANTFTGDIEVFKSSIGINSNQSLGNAANVLTLRADADSIPSALRFLQSGIDLARPLIISGESSVEGNRGDINTISGSISGLGNLYKEGDGTLVISGNNNNFFGSIFLDRGTLRIASGANIGPDYGSLHLRDQTTLLVTDNTSITDTIVLGGVNVSNPQATVEIPIGKTVTFAAPVVDELTGPRAGLLKTGPGKLVLARDDNSYSGGTTVQQGELSVVNDAALGAAAAPVSVAPLGTLSYITNSTTSRTFSLTGGTLVTGVSNTLTFANATVAGGFLSGNFATQNSSANTFAGVTTFTSTSINQAGADIFMNMQNGGQFTNAAGATATLTRFNNTSSGRVVVNGTLNASELTSDGSLAINNGGTLINNGAALVLGGGSRTTIGSVATPGGNLNALSGIQVNGGLLVNNGVITGPTIVNYGSLAKGAGVYGAVNVSDGGKFSPGNSPGAVTTGSTTWSSGGGYLFEINDAAGVAGTNWDLWNISGGLSITAGTTTNSRFTISLASLNASNAPGDAANFSSANNYSWLIASTTTGISGFDTARFTLDTSTFTNPTGGGTFALSQVGNNLFLNFTGVPVPPQWNVDASGSWSTAANWLPPSVPNGPTAAANFLGKITAPRTVTLDGNKQVQQISFDNANSYTIAPGSGGTLTIGNGTTGSITVTSGSHEISAPIAFSGIITKSGGGTLTISGAQSHSASAALTASNGQLNLNSNAGTTATGGSAAISPLAISINNSGRIALGANQDLRSLDLTTTDPGPQQFNLNSPAAAGAFRAVHVYAANLAAAKTSLYAAMRNALGPGVPDPTDGIFDSSRGLHANSGIGLAQVTDAHGDGNIFIRLTRIGDLNLDGNVSISDFIDLAAHFNSAGTWQEGDLNYDGQVSISDFIDLASNFNSSYAGEVWPISPDDQQTLAAFAAANGISVPEPNLVFAVLAISIPAVAGRRRRK